MREEKKLNNSIDFVSIKGTKKVLNHMMNCICKIKMKGEVGTGFFCKIPFKNETIKVLMTNYHVLGDKELNKSKNLNLLINDDKDILIIDLNIKRNKYFNEDYDITIIELKDEDKIKYYLELDDNLFQDNSEIIYIDRSIYIPQYPKGKNAYVSYGLLNDIDKYNIMHRCSTDNGSSGAPIINLDNNKVIGMHSKGSNYNYNIGIYLKYPLKNYINKKLFIQMDKTPKIYINKIYRTIQELKKDEHINIPVFNINNFRNNNRKNFNYNKNKFSKNNLLKESSQSVNELIQDNFSKKTKTKNISELNNINNYNQFYYLLTSPSKDKSENFTNSEKTKIANKSFMSQKFTLSQQQLFTKKRKNTLKESKEKSSRINTNSYIIQNKNSSSNKKDKIINSENVKSNLNKKKNKSFQNLFKNTYNNANISTNALFNNKNNYQDNKKKKSHSVKKSDNSKRYLRTNKKINNLHRKKINLDINKNKIK